MVEGVIAMAHVSRLVESTVTRQMSRVAGKDEDDVDD
jgi:hypothetical protein